MKRITNMNQVNNNALYTIVAFTDLGCFDRKHVAGFELPKLMEECRYEKKYDLFFTDNDPGIGYDVFEEET